MFATGCLFLKSSLSNYCGNFLLFLLLFFAFSSAVFGQQSITDRLLEKQAFLINQGIEETDSVFINNLNALAASYSQTKPDSSWWYSHRSNKLANQAQYDEGKVEALRHLGFAYYLKGKSTLAISNLKYAISIGEKINNSALLAKCYNTIAIVFKSQSKYSDALDYYLKSLKIKIQLNDVKGQANTYGNIGIVFRNLDEYSQAIGYYEKSLHLFRKLKDSLGISSCLGNIGLMYLSMKDYEESERYIGESIKWKTNIGDLRGLSYDYGHLGEVLFSTNRLDSAFYYFQMAIRRKSVLGEPIPLALSLIDLSDYYLLKGNQDKTLELLLQASKLVDSVDNYEIRKEVHQKLAHVWGLKHQFQSAYFHQSLANMFADSLKNEIFSKKMSLMEIRLQEQLQFERQKVGQEFQESQIIKHRYWIMTLVAVLLLLLLMSFYLFRDRIKLQQSHLQLKSAHDEISRQHHEIELKSEALVRNNEALTKQREELNFLNAHLQLKIAERTAALQKRNISLKNYTFSLSHLLRKHVANILGLSELLLQTNVDAQDYHQIITLLNRSANNLDEAIREMNHQLQSGQIDDLEGKAIED